jgi:hypothetical protein
MPAVAPLALDKDKDVRTAAVAALHVIVARAAKEAEVTAAGGGRDGVWGRVPLQCSCVLADDEWSGRVACGRAGCDGESG